ncbi:MAG: type II toxin-antitoxin system Phd/YefM family antitoxin [Luteolibacter sp.]
MKTASVRDLRNRYTSLLSWIGAGEEVIITQRGKAIARLVPEQGTAAEKVKWSESPAVKRNRIKSRALTAKASADIIHEASGKW